MYPNARTNSRGAGPGNEPTVFIGPSVLDAAQVTAAPGAVAMADGVVVAAGAVDQVRRAVGGDAPRVELPDRLLLPGLVNAHTHLELATTPTWAYEGDFVDWVRRIRTTWPVADDPMHTANRQAAVAAARRGAELCQAAGVLRVGDISRFVAVVDAVAEAGMQGVGYVELFGVGPPWDQQAITRIEWLQTAARRRPPGGMRLGLQPHAPYSAGPAVFDRAVRSPLPVATHLAETEAERQFVADAAGAFRAFLEQIGKWDDAFAGCYGDGRTPVRWLGDVADSPAAANVRPMLCAHCNYVSDDDITLIADRGWSVAYCPRASAYFGHAGHRYRDMLEADVNVCLGTDSIICTGDLSILNEMRRLYQRDAVDPRTLLAMATTRGMRGLGLDPIDATFATGARPGLIAIRYDGNDPTPALEQVLATRDEPPIEVIAAVHAKAATP